MCFCIIFGHWFEHQGQNHNLWSFRGVRAVLGTPRGSCWGQNLKLLSYEPLRQVRSVFASFWGAALNQGVKALIFGLFGGGHFGYPVVTVGVKN